MKPLQLVRNVVALGMRLRSVGGHEGLLSDAARQQAGVRALRMTTEIARRLQDTALPVPGAAERLVLTVAASQLRALSGLLPASEPESDREDAGITVEGEERAVVARASACTLDALRELVSETLALVDKVLRMDAELKPAEKRAKGFLHR